MLAIRGVLGPLTVGRGEDVLAAREREACAGENAALFALALVRRMHTTDSAPNSPRDDPDEGVLDVIVSCRDEEADRVGPLVGALRGAGVTVGLPDEHGAKVSAA
ncbi:hypothetical protein OH787_06120 [Streptomyces sp. NBC_01547]|uniref:hypothetical protein n=1 Tax=Streptomyces sp. NBC_01547 TaxID=2975873 RepID=UPI00386BAC4D